MSYSKEDLHHIYSRTSGYCHLCGKKLAFKNYGQGGARGAWEVEHSNARANGGTNRKNNLYAACIACNRSKGTSTTRSVRAKNGKTRAPLSYENRKVAKAENAFIGGVLGATVGYVFGPFGAMFGSAIGAHIGYRKNPDK